MRKIDTAKIWNLQEKTNTVSKIKKFVHSCVRILYDHLYSLLLFELSLSPFLLFFQIIFRNSSLGFLKDIQVFSLDVVSFRWWDPTLLQENWSPGCGEAWLPWLFHFLFFSIQAGFTALAFCWLSNTVNLL